MPDILEEMRSIIEAEDLMVEELLCMVSQQ